MTSYTFSCFTCGITLDKYENDSCVCEECFEMEQKQKEYRAEYDRHCNDADEECTRRMESDF
jgi:hypothetical protein